MQINKNLLAVSFLCNVYGNSLLLFVRVAATAVPTHHFHGSGSWTNPLNLVTAINEDPLFKDKQHIDLEIRVEWMKMTEDEQHHLI